MADNWQIFPPWTSEQGPTNISSESLIRDDFKVVNQTTQFENMISLDWTDLSHQEVAKLRNLISSQELKELLLLYNYGLSWGAEVNMVSEEDSNDAECGFTIHSKKDISETSMQEIISFIKSYKVH